MRLSFDLDEVQAALAAPAAPTPARAQSTYLPLSVLPLEPNSTLDRVTVLRDRAIVTRERAITRVGGTQRVRFEGLPLGLDASSLHAEVSGEARVSGVELSSGQGDVDETERIAAIRTEAEKLSEDLGRLRDHIESLLMQRTYLRGAVLPASGDTRPLPSLDTVRGTLTWVGEAERDLAARLRSDEEKASQLGEKLEPLLVKLKDPLATGATVRVDIEGAGSGTVVVKLRYTVLGAGWTPSYAARLDPETNVVTLETHALVKQATGEDWKDVPVQLSTAAPTVGGAVPDLSPWIIDESGVDAYSLAAPGGVRTGAGAMVFDPPGKRSIAGDGSATRITIAATQLPTSVSLGTVPRVVPEVFRAARATWSGEAPLLPGTVASYVGGDYVGSAQIGAIAPGEIVDLGFGVDGRLKVDRELVSRKVEHLVGGRTRYTVRYRVTVANYAKTRQVVTLSDQVPVSQVDRITVNVLDGTPPTPDPAAPAGVLCWPLDLAPGESEVVEFGFVLTAPRELRDIDQMLL
ncbi:MAG: mucoidy inhibitor MuiA family protein [Deltaproteobacteria bacterium]|nr:mucoidy inhibitor MuiA family protein [Deltaproteobacteria bacterium]